MERFLFPSHSSAISLAYSKKRERINPYAFVHVLFIYYAAVYVCDHKPFAWMTKQILPTVITYLYHMCGDVGKKN